MKRKASAGSSLQARTSVTSRASSMDSPDWKPAHEFSFKTPKSPSPERRTTRRSSVYKFTAKSKTSSPAAKFKMPTKVKSPPGAKTRARRSSIYQKSAAQLSSPPASRTRRRSMYVSAKPGLQPLKEFSKVWSTPIKPIKSVMSPEKVLVQEKSTPARIGGKKTPKSTSKKLVETLSPESKSKKTPASSTAKKTPKSTKGTTNKSPAKSASKQSQKNQSLSMEQMKTTPKSKSKKSVEMLSPESKSKKTPAISATQKTLNSTKRTTNKTPAKSASKKSVEMLSPENKSKKTPAISVTKKTPNSTKGITNKTPAKSASKQGQKNKGPSMEQKKTTPVTQSVGTPILKRPPKSALKSSVQKAKAKKSPKLTATSTPTKSKTEKVLTSTPSKSVEEISGKSFYSTPKQTPIPPERHDELFVFSSKSVQKKSVKRAVIKSPQMTPHRRTMKTPKKTPLPKNSSRKKRARNDSAGSSPVTKRVKRSPNTTSLTSVNKTSEPQSQSPSKPVLTPSEMNSILMDVVETERKEMRQASLSPSPRPRKLARLAGEVAQMSTPRVTKVAKRASPKKLIEVHDRNQSSIPVTANTSILDETINTDSRSGRCVIL